VPDVREAIGLKDVLRFTTLQTCAAWPEIMPVVDAVLADVGRHIAH